MNPKIILSRMSFLSGLIPFISILVIYFSLIRKFHATVHKAGETMTLAFPNDAKLMILALCAISISTGAYLIVLKRERDYYALAGILLALSSLLLVTFPVWNMMG